MTRSVARALIERLPWSAAPAPAAPVHEQQELAPGVVWTNNDVIFSACNEDTGCEIRALRLGPGKKLFCVTAGGGRVLSLLGERPREVWAVDLNPCQTYLLELKVAALRALEHDAYLRFLGVRPSATRLATYELLRPQLTPAARSFFDAGSDRIARGLIYQGRLERFFSKLAIVLRLVRPFGLDTLFGFTDLSEQRRFLQRLDTPLFRAVAHTVLRRECFKYFSGDPGFYKHLPEDLPLHRRIYDNIVRHLGNHLARENHVLALAIFGKYINEAALPQYLNAATYARVRAGLAETRLNIITGRVDEVLAQAGPDSFDAFSLSDICSYLHDDAFDHLYDLVFDAARPAARMVSRGCIVHRELKPPQARRLRRDQTMEHQFAFHDFSMVHQFVVGEIA
ncbi:MAG TPA: DUF3419 family protein [Polyangia bacterium]|jgi:S-adenosylmethionine-diacylglycerol 3-amino-3-carboxypropyl transferase